MRAWLAAMVAALGLAAALPVPAHAQSSTLTGIERQQRQTLDANSNVLTNERQGRTQIQLDLEKATLDTERRQREDYRFQTNTQQRALENQLREDAIRIGQQDQANRERDVKQRQEEQRSIDDARRRQGLQ
jgi:hypothetical protein